MNLVQRHQVIGVISSSITVVFKCKTNLNIFHSLAIQ